MDEKLREVKRTIGLLVNEVYDAWRKNRDENAVEEALYQKYRGDSLSRMEEFNEGVEKGRKIGQEEAWSLARRVLVEDFSPSEYVALKNALQLGGDVAIEKRIITRGSYAEVAAKVEEFNESYRQRHPEWEGEKHEPKSDENDAAVEHEFPVDDDPVFASDADDSVFVKLRFQDNAWLLLKLPDTYEKEVGDKNGLVSGEGGAGGVSS